jgi:hypothetical protein
MVPQALSNIIMLLVRVMNDLEVELQSVSYSRPSQLSLTPLFTANVT